MLGVNNLARWRASAWIRTQHWTSLRCSAWVLTSMAAQACFYNPTNVFQTGDNPTSSGLPNSTGVTTTDAVTSISTDDAMTETAPTSVTAATSGSSTSATDGTDATAQSQPECVNDGDCGEADIPFCVSNKCVTCDKTPSPAVACAGKDATAPVCAQGACVECTADDKVLCKGTKPTCGPDNICTACTEHSDCMETACNLETGACLSIDYRIHVDSLAPCDGDGSVEAPFCKISLAIAKMAGNNIAAGWTIKIHSGNYVEEPLMVPAGSLLAMISWDGIEAKIRALPGSGPTLNVSSATRLFIDRLSFSLNDEFNGIACTGANVWIDQSRMANNADQGYESVDCDTWIRRSAIYKNGGGGIASYGSGDTWITDSYVTSNGTQILDEYGGVRSSQGNKMHVLYSAVISNLTAIGPRSLECTPDAGPAEIRNSVIIAYQGQNSIDCKSGTFLNSALDEDAINGDTNVVATGQDIVTFFNPPINGIYTAKPGTMLDGLAVWKSGDPKVDFDGTARANIDGAPDFAGADKPNP